ncbi:MAG TPA: hypothetical protein PL100_07810 [Bacillota bacterium]|nr:hypothetical protein [Bacillota bacterium]HQC49399.1 hypothetical protein [Bacillota bacterium]
MKTYEEMAQAVLERRDDYVKAQRVKRKKYLRVATCCVILGVLVVAVVGILNTGLRSRNGEPLDSHMIGNNPADYSKHPFPGADHDKIVHSDDRPSEETDTYMIWKRVKDKDELRLAGDFREVSKEIWQDTFHVDLPDAKETAYYLVYKIIKDDRDGAIYTDDLMCGYVELTNEDGSHWSMYLDESSLSTESAHFLCESPGSWQESIINGNRVMLGVSDEHRYAALSLGEYSGYICMRNMDEAQALSVLQALLQKGNYTASSADAERTGMAKLLQCAGPEGSRIFVSSYKVDGHFQDKYKVPSQGEAFFSFPLGFAIQDYGNSAIYTVVASLFIGERPDQPPVDKTAIRASELQRLNRLGYNVSLYKESADAVEPGFLFQATYDQLMNFPASDDYGYFIYLKDEGPNHYK